MSDNIREQLRELISRMTPEEFNASLERAGFDFYKNIKQPVFSKEPLQAQMDRDAMIGVPFKLYKLCHRLGKIERAMKKCKDIGGPFGPFKRGWNAERRRLQVRYQFSWLWLGDKKDGVEKDIARLLGYLSEARDE